VKSLSVTSRYLAQFGYLKLLRLLETRTQLELRKKGTGHGKSLRNRIVFKNIKQRTRRTDKIFPPRPLPLIQPSIRLAINNHTKLKMSNLQKLESDPEMEVVPHTPAKWNNWRTESSRGQLLRDILANGHPPLPNGKSFDEEKARKFVEQEFARRGCKRQAEPVILALPESPRAASPLQPRASVRRSERSVAANPTMEPSQFSHSGRNVSPQQRDPSTAIRPDSDEQGRKDMERENEIFEQQAVDHGNSPEKAKNIAEDRFGFNQVSNALKVSMERRRALWEERNLNDTKPTAREEHWLEFGYQLPPPGTDSGTRSAYLEEWVAKYWLNIYPSTGMGGGGRESSGCQGNVREPSKSFDVLLEQQPSSEERNLKGTRLTRAEEYWTKHGYKMPPPGTDRGTRSLHLTEWISKHGLHRGHVQGPTTSYSGMGNKHPSYQQSGPESRMGNQHSSGRTEDLATERRNVQFDEIINQLADDLREQMRKKERAEGGRRDPDEGWERFKDALDEFRSR